MWVCGWRSGMRRQLESERRMEEERKTEMVRQEFNMKRMK
jgi:hypothetical protein